MKRRVKTAGEVGVGTAILLGLGAVAAAVVFYKFRQVPAPPTVVVVPPTVPLPPVVISAPRPPVAFEAHSVIPPR
jgi:hypothetical protein